MKTGLQDERGTEGIKVQLYKEDDQLFLRSAVAVDLGSLVFLDWIFFRSESRFSASKRSEIKTTFWGNMSGPARRILWTI